MINKLSKTELLVILMFAIFYITFVTFLYATGMMDMAFAFVTWIPKVFFISIGIYFSAKYLFKNDENK